ncbi:siderophore-interacting protein [Aeromicrobium sp.]|uniref:siderophore-interacting protein n=1 Tax=Aeromicrobium sp. TaxID=1871063 RepID=UPI0035175F92
MSIVEAPPATLPLLLEEVEVAAVRRVSPSFVRLELAGPALAELGPDGPLLDQRFKLLVPAPGAALPDLRSAGADWWTAFQRLPERERGTLRTYTIRDRVGEGAATRLQVDVVVHADDAHEPGPGCRWALAARPGDRALVLAPRRGHDFGGIEWAPGTAEHLVLAGDETALPAIRGILRGLPADARGAAVVELPLTADVPTDVVAPAGIALTWLPRDGAARGAALHAAVLAEIGAAAAVTAEVAAPPSVDDDEVDPDLWETPAFSSSGEPLAPAAPSGDRAGDVYAWIAGESRVVTGLRRALVNDLGLPRSQVAFMGYWREGVAMRG